MSLLCSTLPRAFSSHLKYKSKPIQWLHTIDIYYLSDIISFHCPLTHSALATLAFLLFQEYATLFQAFAPVGSLLEKRFLQLSTKLAYLFLSSLFVSKAVFNIQHPSFATPSAWHPLSYFSCFLFLHGTCKHWTNKGFLFSFFIYLFVHLLTYLSVRSKRSNTLFPVVLPTSRKFQVCNKQFLPNY